MATRRLFDGAQEELGLLPIVAAGAVVPPDVGLIAVWNGSAWVQKPVKCWNGSAWIEKPVKYWNGSAWVSS